MDAMGALKLRRVPAFTLPCLLKHMMKTTLLILSLMSSVAAAVEFYVAPSGSDQSAGTKSKPFQTLAAARDAVAKINSKMGEDITVYLAGGTYTLTESVVFDADDSGMNGHKVIYKAFGDQEPIISSGKQITGWQLHDKEKNIYKASVGELEFRQIHVNGERGIRARYPNLTDKTTLGDYFKRAKVIGQKPYKVQVMADELKDSGSWSNLAEVEVVMVTHWKQKRARIKEIVGNMIHLPEPENTARTMFHLEQPGTPHFYENCYEFLDAEGEFYLNTKTDTLFYKPRAGEDMNSIEVVVPMVETLVDIKGESAEKMVQNLVFDGITFQYSKWTTPNQIGFTTLQSATSYANAAVQVHKGEVVPGAIQLQNAKNVEIRSCTVKRTSAHGILAIQDVVTDCSFVGNHIIDVAAGGIYFLLQDAGSTGNKITDNTIEQVGTVYSNGCGILVTCTPDVTIHHNEIRDVRYTGISVGWSWDDKDTAAKNQDVGYNLIHRVMGLHDDGGGVYSLGKIPGMKVHNNYIHNITRSKFSGSYGICGIYLDNGSCQKLVSDNVIENVEAAFFSGNKPNHDNTFEKNYHNGQLAKIIDKANTVRDNIQVKKQGKTTPWPKGAVEIINRAGPRGEFRRPEKALVN